MNAADPPDVKTAIQKTTCPSTPVTTPIQESIIEALAPRHMIAMNDIIISVPTTSITGSESMVSANTHIGWLVYVGPVDAANDLSALLNPYETAQYVQLPAQESPTMLSAQPAQKPQAGDMIRLPQMYSPPDLGIAIENQMYSSAGKNISMTPGIEAVGM